VLAGLAHALEIIDEHRPERILTLGGDCSVSVAPVSWLARRYGEDLAVLWVDSHPDAGTLEGQYAGFQAMALSPLLGHGDADVLRMLSATIAPARVALAGLHAWDEDAISHGAEWGIRAVAPEDLHVGSGPVLDWLRATGCSRVAIHFDVDVVDSNEIVLGLGAEQGGLTNAAPQGASSSGWAGAPALAGLGGAHR